MGEGEGGGEEERNLEQPQFELCRKGSLIQCSLANVTWKSKVTTLEARENK